MGTRNLRKTGETQGTEDARISSLQLFALLTIARLVPVTIIFPLAWASPNVQDLWIGAVAALPPSLVFALFVVRLGKAFPGKTIFGILLDLFGPVFGRIVGLGLLTTWFFHLIGLLRSVAEVHVSAIMTETPEVAFIGAVVAAGVYAARAGIEPVARTSEIVLIAVALFFCQLLLLPLDVANPEHLQPILQHGWETPILSALNTMTYYSSFTIIGMVLPYLGRKEGAQKPVVGAVLISGALIVAFILMLTMVFGPLLPSLAFPAFSLARIVSVANFLERTESLGMVVWVLSHSLEYSLLVWCCSQGLAELLGLSDGRPLIIPLGFLSAALASNFFGSGPEMHKFYQVRTIGTMLIGFHLVLVVLLLGGLIWKKARSRSES